MREAKIESRLGEWIIEAQVDDNENLSLEVRNRDGSHLLQIGGDQDLPPEYEMRFTTYAVMAYYAERHLSWSIEERGRATIKHLLDDQEDTGYQIAYRKDDPSGKYHVGIFFQNPLYVEGIEDAQSWDRGMIIAQAHYMKTRFK